MKGHVGFNRVVVVNPHLLQYSSSSKREITSNQKTGEHKDNPSLNSKVFKVLPGRTGIRFAMKRKIADHCVHVVLYAGCTSTSRTCKGYSADRCAHL